MLKNMKIGSKLLVAFITISLLTVITGIVSTVLIKKVADDYNVALREYGFAQGEIANALTALEDAHRSAHDIISFIDEDIISQKQSWRSKSLIIILIMII